ncbi:UDP-N-acetylglucosamine 2-epimerase [Brevibacterium yomogidense]|uniref:UDP-N-acetylglucosamine 2-epimerase (non-hydrolyzing) n=1 Tax=Brevibacterium yomogidense TaxID=946573 RepID=A0A1X6X104_9MICO|nr:UDP-N-acetylglucosamine 2-epimerase [Brevibacterium yomogidense]
MMVVYGTRPEAIKVAPVIRALEAAHDLDVFTVITAQHREMLDQVNRIFQIRPDADLNLMSPGQTLNGLASAAMERMDELLVRVKPHAVLVQGDTTTVMAAAIAAFNREISVLHLEAGLRSGNLHSPFPEEANRKLVSQIARMHFAPTQVSKANLIADGIGESSIVVTGNTVIDSFNWAVKQNVALTAPELTDIREHQRIVLLTAHRRENLGKRMEDIGRAVRSLAEHHPSVLFVWPAHKNPVVRASIRPFVDDLDNVLRIEPVDYDQFAQLIARSDIILTDSGGIQEEAPSLGKPVLVLRTNTERPEAVSAGTVKLIGTEPERVIQEVSLLLDSPQAYARMANAVNPYGDGRATERVIAGILSELMDGAKLPDFSGLS